MLKLAVLGGTFNPIHNGHLHLIRRFRQIIGADRFLVIPTGMPPHKTAPDLAPGADRLAMCRLAAKDGLFEVSGLELGRTGPSYTSDTLREIKRNNPGAELYFITGEDMFLTLADWHEPEVIFSLATICAAPRGGSRADLDRYAEKIRKMGAQIMICGIDYLPVSSTQVRDAVRDGADLSGLVPPEVEEYIRARHLYAEEPNESGRV